MLPPAGVTVSNSGTPESEVIESGSDLVGQRLRAFARTLVHRLVTWRVLMIVVVLVTGLAIAALVDHYRHRLAAEDRVSLATASDTSLNVDLATRTLLLELSIENGGPYAVTLDSLSVGTPGLVVEPLSAGTQLPARLPTQDQFQTTLQLRPDCTNLPKLPAFRVIATSSRGRRHIVLLPPYEPIAQLWMASVRSACFGKPE